MTVMKIDEFAVPGPSLDEFLAEAGRTQSVLARQPGFVAGHILRLSSGASPYNVVSVVQWAGLDAVEGARRAVETDHRARGFDAPSSGTAWASPATRASTSPRRGRPPRDPRGDRDHRPTDGHAASARLGVGADHHRRGPSCPATIRP